MQMYLHRKKLYVNIFIVVPNGLLKFGVFLNINIVLKNNSYYVSPYIHRTYFFSKIYNMHNILN